MIRKNILLISLSNIGDAVMTTPVLQALHDLYPQATIDIVADARSSQLFEHCPYRGNILHKDKRRLLRGAPALLWQLRSYHYDLVVDLRTDGLAWLLHADRRLTKWRAKPYGVHAVERHMGVIRPLHGDRALPSSCLWLNDSLRKNANMQLGSNGNKRLLGLGLGANWSGKVWPLNNYVALLRETRALFDGVLLLGRQEDRALSAAIVEETDVICIDYCGETELLEAAALLEQVTVFVGNDSGLGHIASAVGTATLTLFGPGQPDVYHPWGEKSHWLVNKEKNIGKLEVKEVVRMIHDDMLQ